MWKDELHLMTLGKGKFNEQDTTTYLLQQLKFRTLTNQMLIKRCNTRNSYSLLEGAQNGTPVEDLRIFYKTKPIFIR